MDISNCKSNFFSQNLLINFHLDYLIRKSLMEQSVYLCSPTELHSVHTLGSAPLYCSFKIYLQVLNTLQHCFCLDAGVIRLEVFILGHLLLQPQHLALQLVSQGRECLPDVVGQLLIQLLLQVRSTTPISHMAVGRVGQEKFPFCCNCCFYVFLPFNILLASVDNPNISSSEWEQLILHDVLGISSFIHQV